MLEKYPENRYEKMLEELKQSDGQIPLAIKGGAALGRKVYAYLKWAGIKVDCFLLDELYFCNNMFIEGIPVYSFEKYLKDHTCNLVIGHGGYEPNQISKGAHDNINKIYDYDFIGRTILSSDYSKPITKEYIESRKDDILWIYSKLADQKSVSALDSYLYQRIYGNYGKEYELNQYFPEDIISVVENEVFVDCGAYQGETLLAFSDYLNKNGIKEWQRAIAFEPEPDNIAEMKKNIAHLSNVQFEQTGVYSESKVLFMNSGDGSNSSISDAGDISIEVQSIDDVLDGEKATFIKMDIEGSEMEALRGSKNTILKYKPKLAICIYHKREDFVDIPRYINSLRDDYKFYIRNHSSSGIECVLYAV